MTESLGSRGMERPGLVWAFHMLSVPLGPRLVTEPCKRENLSYCRVFILLSSHDSILWHCTLLPTSNTLPYPHLPISQSSPPNKQPISQSSPTPATNSLGDTYKHASGNTYMHLQGMYMCIPLLFSFTVAIMYFPQVRLYSSNRFPSNNRIHWEWQTIAFFTL